MKPRVSIVVPVYDEGETIVDQLHRLLQAVQLPCEVLVVYDASEDPTVPYLEKYAAQDERVKPTLNTYGRGPARAIRFGIDRASADVIVVTMADGSDDPLQIDELVRLVENGAVIAAASRYMQGGGQIGGPLIKRTLSRLAGISLYRLAGVGTHDVTSSFKAYSGDFVRSVGIEADAGFEVAIELVAKARRLRLPVTEIPTVWRDRTAGRSSFRLAAWIPHYLRWYLFAFGPRLTVDELNNLVKKKPV